MEGQKEAKVPLNEQKFDILPNKIIKAVNKVFDKLNPSQVNVEFLEDYRLLANNGSFIMGDYSPDELIKLCGKFLYIKGVCENNSKVCEALQLEADRRLENEESLAQLERAIAVYGVVNEKTGKTEITDGKAKAYINTDSNVLNLRLLKNGWLILNKYYIGQMYLFDKQYDWAKSQLDRDYRADLMANKVV